MSHNRVVLLLGSNLGDQRKNLEEAILLLNKKVGEIIKQSKFLFSDPVEFDSTNIFCNIALSMRTIYSPMQLLKIVKDIERQMGRWEDSSVFGEYRDRVIDIDIVQFENLYFECEKLKIPHYKHLNERLFSKEVLDNLEK